MTKDYCFLEVIRISKSSNEKETRILLSSKIMCNAHCPNAVRWDRTTNSTYILWTPAGFFKKGVERPLTTTDIQQGQGRR